MARPASERTSITTGFCPASPFLSRDERRRRHDSGPRVGWLHRVARADRHAAV